MGVCKIIMAKNEKIQILRALSIFSVVLIHTCPNGIWQVICRPFINFGVATFIFLSGYLTKLDNDNWLFFYKKRILKVLIPYIIWNILYSLANGCGVKQIIVNLITTKSAAQLYFVFVYIQFVILTPLLGKFIKSKFNWVGWLIAPVSTIIFKYYWLLSGKVLNKYIELMWSVCCLGWFTYYYLGLLVGNKIKVCNYNIKKLIILYVFSIALQMIEGYGWLILGEVNCGTQLKMTSFLTSSLFILMAYWYISNDKIKMKNKFLILVGDCSFGIYLSHIAIMKVLNLIPFYSHIPYVLNSILVTLLSLICVIIGKKICGVRISKWLGLG